MGKAREQREAKEDERLSAEQQERLDRERSERAAAEIRERLENELSDARRREQERLEAEQREREGLEAEQRRREEKERLDRESQSPPPSPVLTVVPSTPPAKTEADEPFTQTPKVTYPVPPEPEKPPPSSSVGAASKGPWKHRIVLLAIGAALMVGGLIYLAFRPSQSPPNQPVSIAAVTPNPTVTAAPTQKTTWEATYGNGAKIGTVLERLPV